MKVLVRSLLTGLAIVLPLIITIELLRWLLQLVESSLAPLLQLVLPLSWYIPGMAILGFVMLCIVIGYSSRWAGIHWL
ncbi:MAG TPA: hypothetical protein VLA40_05310, partial [Rheinheimera sp.]|nr:hypothetical protein [Rheinheimera sp.]